MAPQAETPGTAGGSPRVARGCNYIYAIREARLFEVEREQLEPKERR